MEYNLIKRTALFGIKVIRVFRGQCENVVTRPLISQIVRSATSVGANYCEADNAESRRDYRHKVAICSKEAKETLHWLRMLMVAMPSKKKIIRELYDECEQLNRIFIAIRKKIRE